MPPLNCFWRIEMAIELKMPALSPTTENLFLIRIRFARLEFANFTIDRTVPGSVPCAKRTRRPPTSSTSISCAARSTTTGAAVG